MSKVVAEKNKKLIKESARQEVYEKLDQALAEYKKGNSKKFKRKLQKASKLFVPFVVKEKSGVND